MNNFSNFSNRSLHGHSHKVMKQHSKTVARSNFFALTLLEKWTSLASDVVNAPMLAIFKKKLWILLKWTERLSANSNKTQERQLKYVYPLKSMFTIDRRQLKLYLHLLETFPCKWQFHLQWAIQDKSCFPSLAINRMNFYF